MNKRVMHGLGAWAAGWAALLGGPAAAQLSVTANGPYYAVPSWSQKLTTNRFVVLANWNQEAVLDRETGLVWERSPDSANRNWLAAQAHCLALAAGGRKGWRLPGIQELASLIEPAAVGPGPMLAAGHPFVDIQPSSVYWSSTDFTGSADVARVASFGSGSLGVGAKFASAIFLAWCVRGGQGLAAQ